MKVGSPQASENLIQLAYEGLESSWNLGEWTDFKEYMRVIKKSNTPPNFTKNFYQAIWEIHQKRFANAYAYIEKAREILDPQITSLLGESYSRAYSLI